MAERALTERFESCGLAVMQLGRAMEGYRDLAVSIVGLSIRGPRVRGDEYLLTLKGVDADGLKWVAFQSATSVDELFRGCEARLSNGTLKWKEDQFGSK